MENKLLKILESTNNNEISADTALTYVMDMIKPLCRHITLKQYCKVDRDRAKEILYDNMSDITIIHIHKIEWLEDWIIDAMIEYCDQEVEKTKLIIDMNDEKI